jgi:peptide/nickel transport system ATP-binding protein
VSETGASLVFITHDLAVLSRIASEAVVLAQGKVVEAGPVAQLLSTPVSPVTQRLLAAAKTMSWKGEDDD